MDLKAKNVGCQEENDKKNGQQLFVKQSHAMAKFEQKCETSAQKILKLFP